MKIIETHTMGEYQQLTGVSIKVETNQHVKEITIQQGEPEDMIFGRKLNPVLRISTLIKEAYKAGKNGEELFYEFNEIEEER